MRDQGENDEAIRLNGKYVWETAKRVCDFIASREELIHITTFGEYRKVMRKVMGVMKEAHNTERKRRWTAKKEKSEERRTRTQRAKALIPLIKRGVMREEDVSRRVETIFGKGSWQEVENATTIEITERIAEMSKREEVFDELEETRREAKRRQREDRRLNIFWKNE